ncbi:hypothetical protein [Herbiconiux sp. L3-i23]|uniref:hypothetical protein n=1 Tax=Herbiconiux sp. L3-i23 TaxID=2905871 RepID=UPI0020693B2E|nr:hypothetical protein [Herbiconiux sp. L3-i23]BDI23750.1 hypothetical protein L3i23_25260 [Herbiconiux sp. L3-i23]
MRPRHAGILLVWIAAAVGGVVSLLVLSGDERYRGLSITLAACALLTFAIQLAFPQKDGFVTRLMASLVGAFGVLLVAALVVLALP